MRRRLTRENVAGTVILAAVFFLIFILPVLVGEAPPELTCGGLAAFVAAHMVGKDKQKKAASPRAVTLEPLSTAHAGAGGALERPFRYPLYQHSGAL